MYVCVCVCVCACVCVCVAKSAKYITEDTCMSLMSIFQ